jgi:hypothetical protein
MTQRFAVSSYQLTVDFQTNISYRTCRYVYDPSLRQICVCTSNSSLVCTMKHKAIEHFFILATFYFGIYGSILHRKLHIFLLRSITIHPFMVPILNLFSAFCMMLLSVRNSSITPLFGRVYSSHCQRRKGNMKPNRHGIRCCKNVGWTQAVELMARSSHVAPQSNENASVRIRAGPCSGIIAVRQQRRVSRLHIRHSTQRL